MGRNIEVFWRRRRAVGELGSTEPLLSPTQAAIEPTEPLNPVPDPVPDQPRKGKRGEPGNCGPEGRRKSKRLNPGGNMGLSLTETAPEESAPTTERDPQPAPTTPASAPLSSNTMAQPAPTNIEPSDTGKTHGPLPHPPPTGDRRKSSRLTQGVCPPPHPDPAASPSERRPKVRSKPPLPPTHAATVLPLSPAQAGPPTLQSPTQVLKDAPLPPTQAATEPLLPPTQDATEPLLPLNQAATEPLNPVPDPVPDQPRKGKRGKPGNCGPEGRRKSKRLNPGGNMGPSLTETAPEESAPTTERDPQPAPTTPAFAPLSSNTKAESVSSVKIFYGLNPTNPAFKPKKRCKEGQTSQTGAEGPSKSPSRPEGSVSQLSPQRENHAEAGAAASSPSDLTWPETLIGSPICIEWPETEQRDHQTRCDNPRETWSDWEQVDASDTPPTPASAAPEISPRAEGLDGSRKPEQHPTVEDDGGRRVRMRRPLRFYDEAFGLSGIELDPGEAKVPFGKKRDGTWQGKKKKAEQPRGRGLAKPRAPARPEDRPEVFVVGDGEFTSSTKCTKLVSTIRLLTAAEMPGPYRTYNMFPSQARLKILRRFMQRYSWGAGEDEGRCLDVFEKIASEAYTRILNRARRVCKDKYGPVLELWKEYCPPWCREWSHWKGLCEIWNNPKWYQLSCTNRANKKVKGEAVIHHVGGSRSAYKHREAMVAERGPSVGLKEVFDRLHMRDTENGKVYVNERANTVVAKYKALKEQHAGEDMSDEALWELAAEGEDRRGRMFGFGNKARICKANKELEAKEASRTDPTRSTATSAENARKTFTESEVAKLVAEKISAERHTFAQEIEKQEERHRAEMADVRKQNERHNACIEALFQATGAKPPGEPSNSQHAAGDNSGESGNV
ncbi:Plant transposase (Ptta/En/Spm family) [Carex littledalei]|uniref:Plant transposase (Ptta/En/Spm family) n=1 Tax=Carex littledalei TaxID=544730 RepID=A0A833VHN5_9POAL|nr:Plant transposase (Ptta/En/Spm family) [Carex littledalei]